MWNYMYIRWLINWSDNVLWFHEIICKQIKFTCLLYALQEGTWELHSIFFLWRGYTLQHPGYVIVVLTTDWEHMTHESIHDIVCFI